MSQICNHYNCNNSVFQNLDECALHCDKNDYHSDRMSGLLSEFSQKLEEYIDDKFDGNPLVLSDIIFPARDSRDNYDYIKLLLKIKEIHFLRCVFHLEILDLYPNKIFYDECVFINEFYIYPINMLENTLDSIFSICKFTKDIKISGVNVDSKNNKNNNFEYPLFSNCTFGKRLSINNCTFDTIIFNNQDERLTLENLEIYDCSFNEKCLLNFSDIELLEIYDCEFLSKLEIKDSIIGKLIFKNSNVKGIFDSFESSFIQFQMEKSIFEDFAGFERVIFGEENKDYLSLFTYVTFKNFSNFREAKFLSGLDLSRVNLKEQPNFLNAYIEPKNTNRETFRIIKNSFDKNGNHIEANKYFSQEMKAYKRELDNYKGKDYLWTKLVIKLNNLISDFGESYIKPIIILLVLVGIYSGIVYLNQRYLLIEPFKSLNDLLNYMSINFLPFTKFFENKKGIEAISLIFYILFLILIWQIVIAVKRHTIR